MLHSDGEHSTLNMSDGHLERVNMARKQNDRGGRLMYEHHVILMSAADLLHVLQHLVSSSVSNSRGQSRSGRRGPLEKELYEMCETSHLTAAVSALLHLSAAR